MIPGWPRPPTNRTLSDPHALPETRHSFTKPAHLRLYQQAKMATANEGFERAL
jgi:hypothetical protein